MGEMELAPMQRSSIQCFEFLTFGDVPPRRLGHEAHHGGENHGYDAPDEGQHPPAHCRTHQEAYQDAWGGEGWGILGEIRRYFNSSVVLHTVAR